MTFGARARIFLGAIRHNLAVIRGKTAGARIMAVIKANAYGHGMLPVAGALAGVDALAVARMAEAEALRASGIETPIAVLGGALCAGDLDRAVSLDVELCIHDVAQIDWVAARAAPLPVAWLKIDTGMNRLGIHPGCARAAIEKLLPHVTDLRLMTHFSSADDPEDPTTRGQLERFLPLIAGFAGDVSVANSPGILGWADEVARLGTEDANRRVWVRPGLSLYGISPFCGQTGSDFGLRPAMQFESHLLSVKPLRRGAQVGYGGTWTAERDTTLGVVAAGYGDGYTRYIPSGTPMLVNGRRVPVIGRVSMDLTTVDLGPRADDKVGDRVILWGAGLPVEEIADLAGTIPYQLLTGVMHREQGTMEG